MRHARNYFKTLVVQAKQFGIWFQMQCIFQKLLTSSFVFFEVYCAIVMVSVVFFVKL